MTNNQKKIQFWKWVNDMVLLNDMTNMFLPKNLRSNFQDEVPQTDDIDVLWEFKRTYNDKKAAELRKELSS
jgi:hypothetical protein